MKNVLITASVSSDAHICTCKKISEDMKQYKEEVHQLLETTWLTTGPKSFEKAIEIYSTLQRKSIPVVVLEVEDVLLHDAEYN